MYWEHLSYSYLSTSFPLVRFTRRANRVFPLRVNLIDVFCIYMSKLSLLAISGRSKGCLHIGHGLCSLAILSSYFTIQSTQVKCYSTHI